MYFKRLNTFTYGQDGYNKKVKNIITAVLVKHLNVEETFLYQRHNLKQGETPEMVSRQLYTDPTLYWTILVVNDIVDPYTEWYMTDDELFQYTKRKYGDANAVHHFYSVSKKFILDEVDEARERSVYPYNAKDIVPVTNFEYERQRNLERRSVEVVNPLHVAKFAEAYQKAMESASR